MPPAPPLDYARAAHPRRRWRRIFLITLLLSITLLGWHFRHPILVRSKLLIAQHRCMNYTAPPGQIVYESDPQRGSALGAASKACQQDYFGTFRVVPPWESLRSEFPDPFQYILAFAPPRAPRCPLFLHQRRSASGEVRLVTVDFYGGYSIISTVVRPGLPWRKPELLWQQSCSVEFMDILKTAALYNDPNHLGIQFYAGQPNPTDESRFTINACIASINIQLHGQLLPDDTIRVTVPSAEQSRAQIVKILGKIP